MAPIGFALFDAAIGFCGIDWGERGIVAVVSELVGGVRSAKRVAAQ
jgi:hypothetical protein